MLLALSASGRMTLVSAVHCRNRLAAVTPSLHTAALISTVSRVLLSVSMLPSLFRAACRLVTCAALHVPVAVMVVAVDSAPTACSVLKSIGDCAPLAVVQATDCAHALVAIVAHRIAARVVFFSNSLMFILILLINRYYSFICALAARCSCPPPPAGYSRYKRRENFGLLAPYHRLANQERLCLLPPVRLRICQPIR